MAPSPREQSETAFFEISNLSVSYGGTFAVRDLSLKIDEGEIVALLGPNGAGKTTTLKAIVGWAKASAGRINFEGRNLTGMKTEDIVRQGVTLVPQGRQVFAKLTVAENLTLGGLARGKRGSNGDRESELLEMFPILKERRDQPAGNLSGGEQQMLVIARALMSEPRMVIFDEPSLGLAPQMTTRTFDLIARLRDEGLTILIVEQNIALALGVSDRAYVLGNGELKLTGDAASLLDSQALRGLFMGVPGGVA